MNHQAGFRPLSRVRPPRGGWHANGTGGAVLADALVAAGSVG
jgi:hypothetical protein